MRWFSLLLVFSGCGLLIGSEPMPRENQPCSDNVCAVGFRCDELQRCVSVSDAGPTGGSTAGGRATAGGATGGGNAAGGNAGGAVDAGFDNTWVRLSPAGAITGRGQAAIAADAVSNSVLVFGGYGEGVFRNDTWRLVGQSLVSWSQVLTTGSTPPLRSGFASVFDPARRKIYIHGGYVNSMSGDGTTWAFDIASSTWSIATTTGPARSYAAMAFDPTRNVVLLFGGRSQPGDVDHDDVWEYNGSSWSPVAIAGTRPPAREAHVAAFDPVGNTFYVFGGLVSGESNGTGRDDAWALAGFGGGTLTWQQINGTPTPPGRWGSAIAYDPDRRLFVLFGGARARFGSTAGLLSDTWTFNPSTNTWRQGLDGQVPLMSPSPRSDVSLTWSPLHRKVLLFGGFEGLGSTMSKVDTWAYGGL